MSIGSFIGTLARPDSDQAESGAGILVEPRQSARTKRRNEVIDVVRLFAAASIVLVHSIVTPAVGDWSNLFRFAVPFFLFASLYYQSLSLRRNTDRSLWQYIAARFKRLYLPFVVWSLIYLVARDIKRVSLIDLGLVGFHPSLLWTGTAYHLWFLPFLLAWSIVLVVVHRLVLQRDPRWRWPLIAIAVAGGFAISFMQMPAGWDQMFDNPTYAFVQWWFALPAACWALAFAWFAAYGPGVYTATPLIGAGGFVLALVCSIKQAFHGIELIPRGLTGLGCMLIALVPWQGPAVSAMARLGRRGYGIYLCHVLIVELAHALETHVHLANSVWLDSLTFALGFAGSLALTGILARSPKLAWLNG